MIANRKPSPRVKALGAAASAAALLVTALPGAAPAAEDVIITTNRPIPYTGDKNVGNPPVGADRMYRGGHRSDMRDRPPMGATRKGPSMANRVHNANGVPFACTGVAETKQNPRWQHFPLRLVYAAGRRGALLSDVRAHIRDARGRTVLRVHCQSSPWLVARLSPGRYSVTATSSTGITRRAAFQVPASGQKRVIVRFPGNY